MSKAYIQAQDVLGSCVAQPRSVEINPMPYYKDAMRNVILIRLDDNTYIIWNWNHNRWDKFKRA